jgi:hypothetical protein
MWFLNAAVSVLVAKPEATELTLGTDLQFEAVKGEDNFTY